MFTRAFMSESRDVERLAIERYMVTSQAIKFKA